MLISIIVGKHRGTMERFVAERWNSTVRMSKVKDKCQVTLPPSGYFMNWWHPLWTCYELVLSKFVRLILKIGSNGIRGHVAVPTDTG